MNHRIKVVFDTNIYISAILFGGNPRICLELARSKEIILYTSRKILVELATKLRSRFKRGEEEIQSVIEGILVFVELVVPERSVSMIKEDPKDNCILECALEAGVDFIISGDKKHILSLKEFDKISIITVKEFLDRFYKN